MPTILNKEVSHIGYGMMGLTWRPTPSTKPQAFAALDATLANNANFWNGGELYGTPEYNSLHLLNSYFTEHPEAADKVILSIKGGLIPGSLVPDGSPAGVRRTLDTVLKVLDGKKFVDIFEYARRDPNVDFAETLKTMKTEYVDTGKIGGIGLSEVSAATIREAAKYVKVAAVEVEISLWARDCLHNGILSTCKELGIPVVAYSPLGRGALTATWKSLDEIPADHPVHHYPRFNPANYGHNTSRLPAFQALATRLSMTPAQLALSWVISLPSYWPESVPADLLVIPGATTVERIEENTKGRILDKETMDEIEQIWDGFEPEGDRYMKGALVNT